MSIWLNWRHVAGYSFALTDKGCDSRAFCGKEPQHRVCSDLEMLNIYGKGEERTISTETQCNENSVCGGGRVCSLLSRVVSGKSNDIFEVP